MGKIIIIILFIIAIIEYNTGLITYIIKKIIKHNNNSNFKSTSNSYFNGKINATLLTKNELNFYRQLKTLIDRYDLIIFSKVRIADIISTDSFSEFNKIRSKHIDFVICNQESCPLLFIELDDSTHNNYKNKKNDIKKDNIFYSAGFKIIRIKVQDNYNLEEIENRIKVMIS